MKILIAYDVATTDPKGPKRLRAVARACADYGQRVQKSVFESTLGPSEWTLLRDRLLSTIDASRDSLRFYFLNEAVRIEHYGAHEPVDFEELLII